MLGGEGSCRQLLQTHQDLELQVVDCQKTLDQITSLQTMANLKPPPLDEGRITFPAEHVMLVTITREKKMNTTNRRLNWQLDDIWHWFDEEPALRVAIITGQGSKAFCAGSDLLEIELAQKPDGRPWDHVQPLNGSGGMARRKGKKPIIAAVNGLCLGGGFEIALNWSVPFSPNGSY